MYINKIIFILIIFLQKIYGATIKFHMPCSKGIRKLIGRWDFFLLQRSLSIYFSKAKRNITNNLSYKGKSNSNIIWIFWWQGYSQMPEVVKQCIKSIKKHSEGHHVILITKDNIRHYSCIPDYIFKKVNNKKITLTHLSDILRFDLLNNYGGLWCDSTLYCTSNLDHSYFNYLYTSGGYKDTDPKFVKGRWTGFLIGGNKHNALFQFMCNYFDLYWKYNNHLINYFLIDLGLHYGYIHNIGGFKVYVDNIACNHNPDLFKLAPILNKTYDASKFKELINDTNMFKITYKMKFYDKKDTVYNEVINK